MQTIGTEERMESLLVDDIDSIRSLEVVIVHILYEYDSHRHRRVRLPRLLLENMPLVDFAGWIYNDTTQRYCSFFDRL